MDADADSVHWLAPGARAVPLDCVVLKLLSLIGFLGMVGGLYGLLATHCFFSPSPLIIALQVLAVLLFLWARIIFGLRSFHATANPTQGGLVTSGPYRTIRHPIYAAAVLLAATGAAGNWSWEACLFAALVVAFAVLRIHCEEVLVTETYPEYAEYAAKSWRMVPFVY